MLAAALLAGLAGTTLAIGARLIWLNRPTLADRLGVASPAGVGTPRPISPRGWFNPWRAAVVPLISPLSLQELQRKLVWAGSFWGLSAEEFYAVKWGLTLGVPLFLAPLGFAAGGLGIVLLVVAALMGYVLLDTLLDRRIEQRQQAIRSALPDLVDLMAAASESGGITLMEALRRAGARTGGVLGHEVARTLQDMQTGSKRDALRAWDERCGVDELSGLIWVLSQEGLGVPLAQMLRSFSERMRRSQMVRMQARANELPVKILFPMMVFMMGPLFVLVLGPVVIGMIRALHQ